MRADTPHSQSGTEKFETNTVKLRRPNDYVVAPLYVNDLVTQCAAYFLAWFATMGREHIRDVIKRGLHADGGLVEEVDWWVSQCESDVETADNSLGYWPLEENGPWTYADLAMVDIARAVRRHTRGWSLRDFCSYGYTVKEMNALNKALAEFASAASRRK